MFYLLFYLTSIFAVTKGVAGLLGSSDFGYRYEHIYPDTELQLACIESLMQDNTHARALTTGQLDHVVSGV